MDATRRFAFVFGIFIFSKTVSALNRSRSFCLSGTTPLENITCTGGAVPVTGGITLGYMSDCSNSSSTFICGKPIPPMFCAKPYGNSICTLEELKTFPFSASCTSALPKAVSTSYTCRNQPTAPTTVTSSGAAITTSTGAAITTSSGAAITTSTGAVTAPVRAPTTGSPIITASNNQSLTVALSSALALSLLCCAALTTTVVCLLKRRRLAAGEEKQSRLCSCTSLVCWDKNGGTTDPDLHIYDDVIDTSSSRQHSTPPAPPPLEPRHNTDYSQLAPQRAGPAHYEALHRH